jgi:hypothetical protein
MATVFRPPLITRVEPKDGSRAVRTVGETGRNVALLLSVAAAVPFSLLDQPNPIRRPAQQFDVGARNATLLGSATPAPFKQTDFPNPNGVRQPQGWTYSPTPTALLTGLKPSGRAALDLPSRAATRPPQADAEQGAPLTLLPFVAVARPTVPTDFQNPQVLAFPIDLRTFIQAPPSLDPGTKPPLTWSLQTFDIDSSVARRSQGDQGTISRALLAGPIAPFAQFDWPVPRGAVPSVDRLRWQAGGPMPFTGGAQPITPSAADNPVARASAQQPTPLPAPLALIGAVPAPFIPPVALNPVARLFVPQADAEQGSPLALLPFGLPFPGSVGPNPTGRTPIPQADAEQGSPLALLPFGLPFFAQDFPNPLRARPVPQADSTSRALILSAAIPSPFAQTDWPNPRGAAQPSGLLWSIGPPMPFSGGAAPVGRAATDLPPRAAAPLPLGWMVSLQTTTLGPVTLPPGLASVDLPPRAAARGVQDYAQAPIASLYAPVVVPFGQHDWQLPTRARTVPQAQIEAHGASLALAATGGTKPFAQTDWQLPPRAQPPIPFGDFWPAVLTTQSANLVSFISGNWRIWHLGYRVRSVTFDVRPRAWLLSEDYMLTLEKRTSESVRFDFDFSQMLGTGETISSVIGIAADAGPATALVFSAGAISPSPITYYVAPGGAVDHIAPAGTVVQAQISGGGIPAGAAVQDYIVRCKVVTSVNPEVEGTGRLRVNDTPVA